MADEYLQAVRRVLFDVSKIKTIIGDLGLHPGAITDNGRADDMWRDVLDEVCRCKCADALHVRLAGEITGADYAALMPLRDSICRSATARVATAAWYVAPAPFEAHFVGLAAQRPFIDRGALRTAVSDVVSGFPVLLVSGNRGAGRSHTWYFIDHVGRSINKFATVLVDIERQWGTSLCGPIDLIGAMAELSGITASFDVDPTAAPDTVPRLLVNRLRPRLSADNPVCIVIDGADRPTVLPETYELLKELVGRTARDELPGLRLVVTGMDETFDPATENGIRRETIDIIDRFHVRQFFGAVAQHLGQDLSPDDLDGLCDRVYAQVGKTPKLLTLAAAVAEIAMNVIPTAKGSQP